MRMILLIGWLLLPLCMLLQNCCYARKNLPIERIPDNFMVIAHRGASGYAPENTLAAINKAVSLKVTHIEIDVRQSKDGHIVLMHDDNIKRTTDGCGKVHDFTAEELKTFDAGSWFSGEFRGEKIPLLAEALACIPSDICLIIEIKGNSSLYPNYEENLSATLKTAGEGKQLMIKSFDPEVLDSLREICPDIQQLQVYYSVNPLGSPCGEIAYHQIHRHFLSHSYIRRAQANGYKLIVWDVNTDTLMQKYLAYGANGIETDYPDKLIEIIAATINHRQQAPSHAVE